MYSRTRTLGGMCNPPGLCGCLEALCTGVAVLVGWTLLLTAAAPASADSLPSGESEWTLEQADAAAPRAVSFRERLIAGSARLIVGATVHYVELDELKQNAIEKIRAREETKYRRQVDKIFDDLEAADIDVVLGVSRQSSREEVIAILRRIDKAALLDAVNAIPDASISSLIERKLRERGASSVSEVHHYLQTEIEEFVSEVSG